MKSWTLPDNAAQSNSSWGCLIGAGGTEKYLPLLVHGDGAFAGQGIFAETLNYSDLKGYTVGGTVHVIVNNLIGFTTVPSELHSSRFAAQLARRQNVPIFHVNAEDVDAVIRIGRIALEYRYKFGSDVVVDLIGYRRHGHSEVDDPTITQPLLYKAIKAHPPLWEIYAKHVGVGDVAARVQTIRAEFEAAQKRAAQLTKKPVLRELPKYWNDYFGGRYKPLDYGMAGALAFASLVKQGIPVRLSGQDSRRATFNFFFNDTATTE